MNRRVYNNDGQWTSDAQQGVNIVAPFLEDAFKALEAAGFNPREAGLVIDAQAQRISLRKMALRSRPDLEERLSRTTSTD
jgi:hypothetical protein